MHFLYDKHQEGVLDNEPSKTTKIFESGSVENSNTLITEANVVLDKEGMFSRSHPSYSPYTRRAVVVNKGVMGRK